MLLEEQWRKKDKESFRKNCKQIMRWFRNFITLILLKRKLGISIIRMRPINKRLLNFFKNKQDLDKKQERCTTIKRTISKIHSSINKKNIISISLQSSNKSLNKKDDIKDLTLNAILETKLS